MLGFVQALHQVCLSFVLLWEIHLHQRCAWGFDFRELQLAEPLLGISEAHVGVSCGYCSLVSFVAGGCCDCRIRCLGLAVCELLVQCAYLLLQRGHVFLHRCFYCIDARLVGSFLIPFALALGVCTRIEVALFGRMVLPFFLGHNLHNVLPSHQFCQRFVCLCLSVSFWHHLLRLLWFHLWHLGFLFVLLPYLLFQTLLGTFECAHFHGYWPRVVTGRGR